MTSQNPDNEPACPRLTKPRSNPSGNRSQDNSLDLQRWHSFKEHPIRHESHSFSGMRPNRMSIEHSENPKQNHSMMLGDKSNSVASGYVGYIEQLNRNLKHLIYRGGGGNLGTEDKLYSQDEASASREFPSRLKAGVLGMPPNQPGMTMTSINHASGGALKIGESLNAEILPTGLGAPSNILLNSTMLSNIFNDRSFHEPIHEISREADFIEEEEAASVPEEEQGSFFDDEHKKGISQIYHANIEREASFSFENPKGLSALLEEDVETSMRAPGSESRRRCSVDTVEVLDKLQAGYFLTKKEGRKNPHELPQAEEPYIRLEMITLNENGPKLTEDYIICAQGLVNSKKNTSVKSITIGRMTATADGIYPNDVVLPYTDKEVGRVHCMLSYRHLFPGYDLPQSFLTFLSGKIEKIGGPGCPVRRINTVCMAKILAYLKPAQKVYAVDLSSISGTYKRINRHEAIPMSKGQIFLFGNSYQISVNFVRGQSSTRGNLKKLFTYLAEEFEDKVAIHGLTPEQLKYVEELREKKQTIISEILKEGDSDLYIDNTERLDAESAFPMLILEVLNPNGSIKKYQ